MITRFLAASCLITFTTTSLHGQSSSPRLCPVAALTSSATTPHEGYGVAMAMSGDVIVIGATGTKFSTENPVSVGAAFVYRRSGNRFFEEDKLILSNAPEVRASASSVAINGNIIAIGSTRDNQRGDYTGAVFMFRFNGKAWIEEAKLSTPDAQPHDTFGRTLAIERDLVAVGLTYRDGIGRRSGAVYTYTYDGTHWLDLPAIVPHDTRPEHYFGSSVALSQDRLFIGATGDSDLDVYAGAVYVYRFDRIGGEWTFESKLVSPDGFFDYFFGQDVTADGDRVMVSSDYRPYGPLPYFSAAYIFRYKASRGIWVAETTIQSENYYGLFGRGDFFSIKGDVAVIGNPFEDEFGFNTGAISIYRYDSPGRGWLLSELIQNPNPSDSGHFGGVVAMDDDTIIVSANQGEVDGHRSGVAYVFQGAQALDDNHNGITDSCENFRPGDANRDEIVNVTDLLILLENFG